MADLSELDPEGTAVLLFHLDGEEDILNITARAEILPRP